MKEVTIVGAGLVGSLWAVYLSKAGYKVQIFERRTDIRKAEISAGKSINLALSDRGWKALAWRWRGSLDQRNCHSHAGKNHA